MPCLRIGHDLANEQTLMNLETILVSLHAIALGSQLGLSRQNIGPACCSFPKERIHTKGSRAFAREFTVHRHGVTAEKSPRSVGSQMDDGLAGPLLLWRSPRSQRQSREQRTAI
jgi:hypothetical protein